MDTQTKHLSPIPLTFINGGGEMGERIRQYNWDETPIGDINTWPQSLRTTLSIIINSKFPMFLFWGTHLICFYNDAYRPSLGNDGKHPSMLGMKGEEAWPEIWSFIKPMIDEVLAGGEASWAEDQLLPIYRNGKMEDVYWTFSYSPVNDETGKPAGVFVTCTETTDKIIINNQLEESNTQLKFAIEATELGTWDYNLLTNKFICNNRLKEWFGLPIEKEIDFEAATNAIEEKDKYEVANAILKALDYSSGGNYDKQYTITNKNTGKKRIVHAKGKAWFRADKIAYRFNGTLQDVTEIINKQGAIQKLADHLKIATESANVGTWSLNIVTQVLEWSPLHKRMWGYDEKNNLTYEDWHKIILPDDKEKAFERVETARATNTFYDVEYRIKKANDEAIRWIRSTGKYFYNDMGEAITLTGISLDITDIKERDEKILESEARFRLLANNMPQLIWTADNEGNINYFNEAVYKYSGMSFDELENMGWLAMVFKDDQNENVRKWTESMQTGGEFYLEHRIRNIEGAYRWHLSRAVPMKNAEGKVQMWIGTSTDIQEQKIKDEKKDEFISIASHEMKTPLTTAKGYLQLLEMYIDENDTSFVYVKKANDAVEKINNLVSELLDSSKIQHGKLNYNISTFNINELLNNTIENIAQSFPKYAITKNGEAKQQINGDKDRIQQVIINLLTNAIKYSPNNKDVLVTIKELDTEVQICVIDTGIGIDSQHLNKLFEKYYRVEEHAIQFQGLGIGLYISYEIIKRHKGNMWVESEVGKGSSFYFTLPL